MSIPLSALFFVSGFSALVFETLWFRQTGLVLGNSIWASSIIWASFMAGLALGSALAARWGERIVRPLRAYAILEGVVAVTGLAIVVLLPSLPRLLAPVLGPFLDRPVLLNSARVTIAFALLLVPATAMGATLPVLTRALVRVQPDFGRALGTLYGWNTLGAVAGALGGEIALFPHVGLRNAGITAAVLETAAALAALGLARRYAAASMVAPTQAVAAPGGRRLLAAASLAGGLLLALEVIWFRLLLLFVFGTSTAFAVMLAVVLLGISVGGLLASRWLRSSPEAHRLLPALALAAGAVCALSYAGFPTIVDFTGRSVANPDLAIFILCLVLTLPTTVASGVLFTFMGTALRPFHSSEIRAAGMLTLANTAGAAVGSLLGAFVLLPLAGVERSLALLSAAYAGVALLTFRRSGEATAPRRARAALVTAGVASVAAAATFPFGLMGDRFLPMAASRYGGGYKVIGIREGTTETILYLRRDVLERPVSFRLVTNSTSMSASGISGERYMRLFSWWPLAFRPDARRALLISYGLGRTAQALTDNEGLQQIDIVDISRDILEMSDLVYGPGERHPLRDPRVRTHVEDGRLFLLATQQRYDVITGEPPPPKSAGVLNLYSREYFALVRDRLTEHGLATYWLPVLQLHPQEAGSIVTAFCAAFPDCSLWIGFGDEWMLAGSRGGIKSVTEEELTRQWRHPVTGAELRSVGLDSAERMAALFLGDATDLAAFAAGAPPLEDDRPGRLSNRPPHRRETILHYRAWSDPVKAALRFARSPFIRATWPEPLRARSAAAFRDQAVLDAYTWGALPLDPRERFPQVHTMLEDTSLQAPVAWLLGSSATHERHARSAMAAGSRSEVAAFHAGVGALAARNYAEAVPYLRAAAAHPSLGEWSQQLAVLALASAGDTTRAAELMRDSAGRYPPGSTGWTWLATTYRLK
jgi:predicted membrane-bound spermidine synthase